MIKSNPENIVLVPAQEVPVLTEIDVCVARRVLGEYYITIDNLVENTRTPNVVSLNWRCLDRHMPGEKFSNHFP